MAELVPLGLRQRQRESRRRRILEAASSLFLSLGFEATSIDAIAIRAELSVPTIYSYFASKHDLLLGLLEEDKLLMRATLEPILKKLPRDPLKALTKISRTCVSKGFIDISYKPIWREISAAALKAAPERRESILRFQNMHVEAIETFLYMLAADGRLRADVAIESASRVLHAIGRNSFRLYLMMEEATEADLWAMLEADLATAFQGFLAVQAASRRRPARVKRQPDLAHGDTGSGALNAAGRRRFEEPARARRAGGG